VKVCDSSTYTYEEEAGPVGPDACGSYEVRVRTRGGGGSEG
jgi:hypothetical protein